MKLYEHPDFDQLVIRTREALGIAGLSDQLVEKDYFVTEVLRIVARTHPDQALFKGGTSLSKAWYLIHRFSEDVDIFLDPQAFDPPLGKRAIDRTLKALRDKVADHPGLDLCEGRTSGGLGRSDRFRFPRRFGGVPSVADVVVLESGTASGREPAEQVRIESLVAAYLKREGISLGCEDEGGFTVRTMHFRRTFVEKMFAIHAKVEKHLRDGLPIGSYARHYYDLSCLLARPEVPAMLASEEYAEIKLDYRQVSQASFPRDYFEPTALSFRDSRALFPPAELKHELARAYQDQCSVLCYGPYPPFDDVLAQFETVRSLL